MAQKFQKISKLLERRAAGLYCPFGGFYIDPTHGVDRAIISHGHADHARPGQGHVLASKHTLEICQIRYGASRFASHVQPLGYHKTLKVGDVKVTFAPAGHILGSAQILIEGWESE